MDNFKKSNFERKSKERKSSRAKSARAQERKSEEHKSKERKSNERESARAKSEFPTLYFFFLFLLPVDDVYDPVHRADVLLQYRGVHTPPLHTHHL